MYIFIINYTFIITKAIIKLLRRKKYEPNTSCLQVSDGFFHLRLCHIDNPSGMAVISGQDDEDVVEDPRSPSLPYCRKHFEFYRYGTK